MTDPGQSEFPCPEYGRRSLAEVLPATATALGVPELGDPGWDLPPASGYLVLLIDGLGAELLRRNAASAPYLTSLTACEGWAGAPSTTATSLTSLGTALPPGTHGMVGYTMRVPDTDTLLNALQWDKRIDPLGWQPRETAFERLSRAGVRTTVLSKREFATSGLTVASQRGAAYQGTDRPGERMVAAATSHLGATPTLTYVYEGDLDWVGHRYGVSSEQWRQQLITVDAQARQLRAVVDPSVRLLVIADHGMIDCPAADRWDVDLVPDLRQGVAMLGGEARFRHVYAVPGAAADVGATWRETLGADALVLEREQAIALGWFGAVTARVAPRIGDVVVACRGTTGVFSSASFPGEMKLVGLHGSLTRDEVLIPVLIG
ncbi:MAG: alkaline phosphatase family protein [Nocardioides sp.]